MDELESIAGVLNITVIEDAAHALGAWYKGKAIGTISPFTAFSFQAIKPLTSGDGGVLCCKWRDDCEQVKRLRWFGVDRENLTVDELGERNMNPTETGFKYHMNDLTAAVALGNLPDFQTNLLRAESIVLQYRAAIGPLSMKPSQRMHLFRYDKTVRSSNWFFPLWVDEPARFIAHMRNAGVESSVVDLRIDRFKVFGGPFDLPNQALFSAHHVALPTHPYLTNADVEHIINAVREYDHAIR